MSTRLEIARMLLVPIVLAALAPAGAAAAEHVLLPPTEITIPVPSAEQPYLPSHYWQRWFPNTLGKNWKSPVNYADGTCHARYVVRKFTRQVDLQICVFWDGDCSRHACGARPKLTGVGQVALSSGTPSSWWKSHPVNWSNIADYARIIVRRPGGTTISGTDIYDYTPLKFNATIVLVSKGATFSGWDQYPVSGGGPPPANQAPVAKNQSVTVAQGGSAAVTLSYTDADGPSPFAFAITQQPSHGSLAGSGATRKYAPNAGYAGGDSFKWKVTDGDGAASNVATVSITVQAPPPNAAPVARDQSVTVVQGGSVEVTLSYADADGPGPYSFTVTDSPSHGSLAGSGGTRTYTPNASFEGVDSFRWKVSDGTAASNRATVTVEVVGDSDGDGLPDWWEDRYGLDPGDDDTDGDGVTDADEDEDGDGSTNLAEYLSGTDPTVAGSSSGGEEGISCAAGASPHGGAAAALVVLAALAWYVQHDSSHLIMLPP